MGLAIPEPVPERTPPDDTTPPATVEGSTRWWRTEVAARDAELERLRAERDGWRDLFEAANALVGTRTDERDALKAAIEKLSARHQPTQAKNLIRCDRHVNVRRVSWEELRNCPDCRDEPITVCSNLACCEYPCADRRAIDAALAVPESNEDVEETGRG